jgi:hypothetical protein
MAGRHAANRRGDEFGRLDRLGDVALEPREQGPRPVLAPGVCGQGDPRHAATLGRCQRPHPNAAFASWTRPSRPKKSTPTVAMPIAGRNRSSDARSRSSAAPFGRVLGRADPFDDPAGAV